MTTLQMLVIIYLTVSVCTVVLIDILKRKSLGWVSVLMICLFFGFFIAEIRQQEIAREDRKSRTTALIGTAIEIHEERTETKGCVQLFKLKSYYDNGNQVSPYTFEIECTVFSKVEFSPISNQVVQIKFVAPKKEEGKPEVLEFLNLTAEITIQSWATSTPEAPPAD